jgi:hypothetical protein
MTALSCRGAWDRLPVLRIAEYFVRTGWHAACFAPPPMATPRAFAPALLSVALAAACGGRVDSDGTGGPVGSGAAIGNGAQAGGTGAPPTPDATAIAAAGALLAGQSFRVALIEIGGGAPGTAPANYRERVDGDVMKLCFGTGDTLTACQCDAPHFASVDDIRPGGSPSDRCDGSLVCRTGTYRFDDAGRLRVDGFDDAGSLLWAVSATRSPYPEAGVVTRAGGRLYVNDLCGLGESMLEPTAACAP